MLSGGTGPEGLADTLRKMAAFTALVLWRFGCAHTCSSSQKQGLCAVYQVALSMAVSMRKERSM
jgi:hypothetical protein